MITNCSFFADHQLVRELCPNSLPYTFPGLGPCPECQTVLRFAVHYLCTIMTI